MDQKSTRKNKTNDVEIIDLNDSIVSIDDSESEDKDKTEKKNVNVILNESEEGELIDEIQDATNSAFEINFQNDDYFRRYGAIIVEALEKTFQNKREPIKCNLLSKELRITAIPICANQTAKSCNHSSKESSPDLSGIKELFTIDLSPSEIPEIVQVPSYKRSIKNVLDEESNDVKRKKIEDACQRARPSAACFNCGVNGHALRDCPKKRNGRRIQKARSKFMTTAEKRYHVNVDNKFPHIKPGVISESLKKALGLRAGEIPYFYYRMRVLGYPPGWLEEAKVQPSGLSLISADVRKTLGEIPLTE